MAQVYRISKTQVDKLVPILNDKDIYVENIKHYLNKSQVKRASGVKSASSVSGVYVSEERRGLTAHHAIEYNDEYKRNWGNQPIYGNILIVVSDKAYATLPAEQRMTT
jgi:hypothetical protein